MFKLPLPFALHVVSAVTLLLLMATSTGCSVKAYVKTTEGDFSAQASETTDDPYSFTVSYKEMKLEDLDRDSLALFVFSGPSCSGSPIAIDSLADEIGSVNHRVSELGVYSVKIVSTRDGEEISSPCLDKVLLGEPELSLNPSALDAEGEPIFVRPEDGYTITLSGTCAAEGSTIEVVNATIVGGSTVCSSGKWSVIAKLESLDFGLQQVEVVSLFKEKRFSTFLEIMKLEGGQGSDQANVPPADIVEVPKTPNPGSNSDSTTKNDSPGNSTTSPTQTSVNPSPPTLLSVFDNSTILTVENPIIPLRAKCDNQGQKVDFRVEGVTVSGEAVTPSPTLPKAMAGAICQDGEAIANIDLSGFVSGKATVSVDAYFEVATPSETSSKTVVLTSPEVVVEIAAPTF